MSSSQNECNLGKGGGSAQKQTRTSKGEGGQSPGILSEHTF